MGLSLHGFYEQISIHALVKRATIISAISIAEEKISIHALVKRATEGAKFVLSTFPISIHALVKRATVKSGLDIRKLALFQSTPS